MKVKAVIEVIVVLYGTLFLVVMVGLSPIGQWERQVHQRSFVEYAVMIAVPLLILLITRRNLASYGLSTRGMRYHLDVAAAAFIPVAIGSVPLAMVSYRSWSGALIMAAVEIAVLFAVAWMLRRKATRQDMTVMAGSMAVIGLAELAPKGTVGSAISAFVFYLLFLALGEELLFQGYIQSRLNAAFGRPFRFFGVRWGWGTIITAALFGSMHVLNSGSLISGTWQPLPWWGFWTFFAGLVLAFVREKTGSIAAPTILHGLPQAVASVFPGV